MGLQKCHGPWSSQSSNNPPLKRGGLAFFIGGRGAGQNFLKGGGLLKGAMVLKRGGLKVLSQEGFMKQN